MNPATNRQNPTETARTIVDMAAEGHRHPCGCIEMPTSHVIACDAHDAEWAQTDADRHARRSR